MIIVGKIREKIHLIDDLMVFISLYRHSFLWNSLWLGLGETVAKLCMFYITVAVIRYLQPADYGQLSVAVVLTNMIVVLLDFGMTQIIIRDLSRQRQKASIYLSQVMSLKIILGCIYFVILLFVPDHLVGRQWVLILLMLGFMNWVQDLSGACISWFMAEERMEKVLYVQLIHYGGMMLAAAATIYFDLGLTTLISGYIIAALLGFYSAIVMIFREGIPIRLIFVPRMIKYLFEQSLPLFGVVLINAIYINADTIMIREYQNINNVAYYQAAYKLLFVLQGLTLLHTALFPKLSILVKNSQKLQTNQLNWIVALFTMIVLVPIAVLANVYAPEILLLLYGDKMLPAVGALQFLIWVGVIYFIKIYVMNLFIANGQQKPLFYIALAALVLNLILDAYFLNHYSFAVAAAVLLFTETFMLVTLVVLRYMQTRKFVDIRSNRLPYMY